MVGSSLPVNASQAFAAVPGPAPREAERSGTVTKQMFLKLLVAQIRNQNPLNPADGTEFLSQLAQFTGLEQMIAIRQQLDEIAARLEANRADENTAAPGGEKG